MRVLGVDPGLTRCGLGVVEGAPGSALTLVAVSVVRTPAADAIDARLISLEGAIEDALDRLRPDAVAVERVFSQHNVRTVMGTAQASAVAITCAARRGLPVELHTPSEVKAAVTGSGRADKTQVQTMVARLLRLSERPRPADAADALALAICHIWRSGMQQRLRQSQSTQNSGHTGYGIDTAAIARRRQREWRRRAQSQPLTPRETQRKNQQGAQQGSQQRGKTP